MEVNPGDILWPDGDVSGRFVDVLDQSKRIVKLTLDITSVIDSHGVAIDSFRLQSLYQGLEEVICNSQEEPQPREVSRYRSSRDPTNANINSQGRKKIDQ